MVQAGKRVWPWRWGRDGDPEFVDADYLNADRYDALRAASKKETSEVKGKVT